LKYEVFLDDSSNTAVFFISNAGVRKKFIYRVPTG